MRSIWFRQIKAPLQRQRIVESSDFPSFGNVAEHRLLERVGEEGGKIVPLATSGASILSSTVRAIGVVIVSREREGAAPGDEVEVLLYDDEPWEPSQ